MFMIGEKVNPIQKQNFLTNILYISNNLFKELLKKNSIAYEYIKARGVIDEAVNTFNIGFAPDHNKLLKHLELEWFRVLMK